MVIKNEHGLRVYFSCVLKLTLPFGEWQLAKEKYLQSTQETKPIKSGQFNNDKPTKPHKNTWTTEWEINEGGNVDILSVPSHFNKYAIANRKFVFQQPQ